MNTLADAINSKAGTSGKKSMDELIDIVNNITSGSGSTINGTVKQYKILSGETINAGDFVEFVNGVTSQITNLAQSGTRASCILLEDNKIFMLYGQSNSYYLTGSIIVVDGNTFTVTTTQLNSTTYSCYGRPSCVLLPDGKVFAAYPQSNYKYLYGSVITISGTTMTNSSSVLYNYEKSCYTNPSCVLVDTNKVFVAHSYSSDYKLCGTIVTINGTSMSKSTTYIDTTANVSYRSPSCALIDTNKVFIAFGKYITGSDVRLCGAVVTISGTSITVSSVSTELDTNTYSCAHEPCCITLENNKVFIAHCHSPNYHLYGTIATIDGTTITTVTTELCNVNNSCYVNPDCLLLSNGEVLVVHPYTDNRLLYKTIVTIDGTTMSASTSALNDTAYYCCEKPSCIMLSEDKIFIEHSVNNTYNYAYGTLYYGEKIRSYTNKIFGVAKTGGTGDDTIDVYVPE